MASHLFHRCSGSKNGQPKDFVTILCSIVNIIVGEGEGLYDHSIGKYEKNGHMHGLNLLYPTRSGCKPKNDHLRPA